MATFKPRTTAPSTSDKHYFSDNVFYQSGYGMPNCTAYAWGRFYELLEELGIYERPKLSTSNAENWFIDDWAYEKGQTPRLGAVAVWSKGTRHYEGDGAGHVAIVEQINADGSIMCSNSGWGGSFFFMTTHASGYYKSGYTFDGFIYLPKSFDDNTTPVSSGDHYYVNDSDGLWLLSASGSRINAYGINTEVEYLGESKAMYGYNYLYVRVLNDGNVGYMASDYLTKIEKPVEPTPEPTPTPVEPDKPSEEEEKEMEELKQKNQALEDEIALKDKTIQELQLEIQELKDNNTYKEEWLIKKDGMYQVTCYENEVLIIK